MFFFLTLSGGEIFLRRDFFELLEYARNLRFCVKLKTNAVLIREGEAERIKSIGVHSIQVSIYSHRAEVHDGDARFLRRDVDEDFFAHGRSPFHSQIKNDAKARANGLRDTVRLRRQRQL